MVRFAALRYAGALSMAFAPAFVADAEKAVAHPHVWVTVETDVLFDSTESITGFKHKWTFDEFYSSFAVQGMDKNNDGRFERDELKELTEINITSLREFGFFTFPHLAGQEIERLQPRDYWLEHKDGALTLNFTLPLKEPVKKDKAKDFDFAIYDPTFYVSFAFAKEKPIRLSAAPGGCAPEITKPEAQAPSKSVDESLFGNLDKMTNFGSQYAQTVKIKCPSAS